MIYVIALEPDSELKGKISSLKTKARKLVGNQLYLSDEPHLTLYVGDFRDVSEFDKNMGILSGEFKGLEIKVNDWFVFRDDPVTKKDSMVCVVEKENSFMRVQENIIPLLNLYRRPGLIERYSQVYDTLDEVQKENCNKYGYPFVGDIWKPHFNIASFDKDKFEIVWEKLKDECPKGRYKIASINLYELDENENMNLVKKWQI